MASHIGVPHFDNLPRPSLYRSRSHSTPSQNATESQSAVERPTRPSHGRSQSYLSPVDPRPRNAATLPTQPASPEKSTLERASSRFHLPGKHHLHHDSHRKHRYTQSEEQHSQHRKNRDRDTDGLPHLVAGLNAERTHRATASQHDAPPAHYPAPGGLTRMMSHRSGRTTGSAGTSDIDIYSRYGAYHRYGGTTDTRNRATSDLRTPQSAQSRVKSPIELDLERAERVKKQRKFTVTQADVVRKDKDIEEAEEEMREKLEQIHIAGMDITRRLDYGYYNLLEKVGSLVGTIQSFQTLASQSGQLVVNFENESDRLDKDMRRRISSFKTGFHERSDRVSKLEERGRNAQTKAENLGRRLENARVIVSNWSKREDRSRKVWGRFWSSISWCLLSALALILALVMWKEWWFRGDPVKAGIGVPSGGHWNASLTLGDGGEGEKWLRSPGRLPDEVRKVLEGIEFRNRKRKDFVTPLSSVEEGTIGDGHGDERLAVLDEL